MHHGRTSARRREGRTRLACRIGKKERQSETSKMRPSAITPTRKLKVLNDARRIMSWGWGARERKWMGSGQGSGSWGRDGRMMMSEMGG